MSKDRSPKSLLGKPVAFRALFIYPSVIWLIVICAWPLDRVFDLYVYVCMIVGADYEYMQLLKDVEEVQILFLMKL